MASCGVKGRNFGPFGGGIRCIQGAFYTVTCSLGQSEVVRGISDFRLPCILKTAGLEKRGRKSGSQGYEVVYIGYF